MQIKMQYGPNKKSLTHLHWENGIIGETLDARENEAIMFIKENCNKVHVFKYNPNPQSLSIEFNGKKMSVDDIDDVISSLGRGSLILETTSLRVDEILLSCKAVQQAGLPLMSLLYTEPQGYAKFQHTEVMHRRDFDLSTEYEPFTGVPGSVRVLNDTLRVRAVFFVGYEGERLKRALDQADIKPENGYVIFGVPAFQPGWEMDSFSNNIRVIRDRAIEKNVLFSGAQNPVSVMETIEKIYKARNSDEQIILVPIGTKPHGIGVALFACQHDDVGIIYDHPNRKKGRSKEVGTWHLFDVYFDKSE
jgi:hypothetical protein